MSPAHSWSPLTLAESAAAMLEGQSASRGVALAFEETSHLVTG